MLPPPDPRTLEGQLRICHNQSAMAVSTLALVVDQVAQLALSLREEYSPEAASAARRDAANLLRLMDGIKTQVDQAHAAANAFGGMLLPTKGRA